MRSISFTNFIRKIIFDNDFLHDKWKKKKFCLMYILRCVIRPITSITYYYELQSMISFNEMMLIQPTLPAKIHRPYLHKGGNAKKRAQYIIGHYKFVQNLPIQYKRFFLPERQLLLLQFTGKYSDILSVYCSSCGFDREGELMLSLYFREIPVCRLSFSIIPTNTEHVFFVGGLQGAPKNAGPEIIRYATKSCYGLFPKRILFEILSALAIICNVNDIFAVSEKNHVFRQLRYRYQKRNSFVAIYSDFWESLGGQQKGYFYKLPIKAERKLLSNVTSQKRSEYRKRYLLLDSIQEKMQLTLNSKNHSMDVNGF
ncbi:DUF535 domain-containing protein [Escherichia coli]|nr:DUF535 domain-containing protein [Escherichia coli]